MQKNLANHVVGLTHDVDDDVADMAIYNHFSGGRAHTRLSQLYDCHKCGVKGYQYVHEKIDSHDSLI